MAADISLEREQMKPCCASWKDKYSKLEERRKALRQAVKLLEQQADKFQLDNINLKKAYEEEQSRSKIEREESGKKSDALTAQEKEISSLKSEVFLLKQRNNSSSEDVDKKLLQERVCEAETEITNLKELLKKERKKIVAHKKESTMNQGINCPSEDAEKSILRVRVSDCESEINKLKELLDIEKLKADAEKKAATAEKNRATAAWKIVKEEKSKANDERIQAEADKEKVEGYRTLLESLKKELDDTRLKFTSEAVQFEQEKKKLEAEMQRATKQKTNVDKERKKTKEQKQLADLNIKLALEEKQRAGRLDKQLAEEKIRVEGLCEEIHQLKSSMKSSKLSTKPISPATLKGDLCKMKTNSHFVNIETINKKTKSKKRNVKEGKQVDKSKAVSVVSEIPKTEESLQLDSSKSSEICCVSGSERVKFLNKQLKFEKLQTKHAMKTAELEKDRTQVLCRELSCLKQEFFHFLCRMDILEGHYSLDTEGIHDLSKIPLQARSLCNTLSADTKKSKLFHVPPSQFCIKGKHDLVVCDNIKQVIKDNSPSLKLSYCNCSKPLPSNDSKFRSPSKGNHGKRIHNSEHEIDSSTASFSDPQMAGSQNKGCFSVLTSAEFSPEKEKHVGKLKNENGKRDATISEKIGRANKKRKKAPDVVDSVEHEHPRGGKGLGLQSEEALNSLPNIGINGEARPSELRDKDFPNKAGNYKGRKKSYKQDENALEKEPATKVSRNAEDLPNICLDNCKESLANSHGYGISDMHMNDLNVSTCFMDYMKLLELDSSSEEERCRNVIEMPLSPTIPDIKFPDCDILEPKSSEELFNEVTSSKQQCMSSSYNSNVTDELHENIPQKVLPEVHNSDCPSENPCDKSCDDCNAVHVKEAYTFNGIEKAHKPMSIIHTKYFIVSPDLKDSSCVSQIYCAVRACAAKCRVLSDSGTVMAVISSYLTTEDYLSPREKASTLFTVLLNHYVLFVLSATGDSCSSSWLSSCSSHFHLGIKSIFTEQCGVDSLFMVIDSFFTNREVLKHKDPAEIKLDGNIATEIMISFNFEGTNITLCPESALPVHILGGSIMLTLVCEALDRYSVMCETSYKILHLNKFDSELKLSILHLFANFSGKKYLESGHNVLVMTVIKSLVTFMEKEISVVSDHTTSKTSSIFSPCDNCVFAEGALSVDNVVLLLLEKIKRRPLGFCDLSLPDKACRDSADQHEDLLGSCFLQDLEMKTTENDCCMGQIVDVLSLLEIIALKMSWEWTYLKIVSPLFEIMESLKNNSILVLIATLLGEVGRMGVENRGYEDAGVQQLRHKLLLLLASGDKSWFHIHIAAAQALVNVLPFSFQQLPHCASVHMGSDLTPLKNWLSSLSTQQRYQISSFL